MRFGVLGPLEVIDDQGHPVDVGGPQPRLVLAALIAAAGRSVDVDALIELIWPDRPPASAAGTLQSYVSRLRRIVEPVDGPGVVYAHGGYRLELPVDLVDAHRFDALADAGHRALASGRSREAYDHLVEALSLWRGAAFVELTDRGMAMHQAAALGDRRLAAVEARVEAEMALGRHEMVVGELRALVDEHPLREGLHAKLALALYRSGRQAESLRAISDATSLLREEFGLEPGRALADLEVAILNHDPTLDVSTAVSPTPTDRRAETEDAVVFVGREAEIETMAGAFAAASRDAQFIVLEGEPGIGKSRLANEIVSRFAPQGSWTAWARSNEIGATSALLPWLDVLRVIRRQVDDFPPMLDELVAGRASSTSGAPSPSRQVERFEAIAAFLERLGATAPVVLVLDDLQWFDPASLDLLRFLTTRIQHNLVAIATLRTLEIGRADALTDTLGAIARRPGSRRLRLTGLSAAQTSELLAAASTDRAGARRSERIHERAEGNPFYTLELARLLDQPGGDDSEVPASISDTVRRRLHHLDAAALDVLTVAAVVGREIDVPLVSAVAGLDVDECAERLDEAAAHRLLIPATRSGGQLRFAHALVREVLLDGLTPLRRARLHLRVADALEASGSDDIEVVAEHLWRSAAMGDGDRAASALERAAMRAVERVAYSTAEDMLHRAVELRTTAASRGSSNDRRALLDAELRLIAVTQARQYFSGTDRTLLQHAQTLAIALGLDDIGRELSWAEWASVSRAADVAAATSIARDYLERWGTATDPAIRASVLVIDGVTAWSRGLITSAMPRLDEAVTSTPSTADRSTPFDRQVLLVGEVFGLYCHAAHGDTAAEEVLARFDRIAASLPDRAVDGRHQVVFALGCRVAAVHHRWEVLERLVRQALELDPAGQFAFFSGQIHLYRALLEARHGDFDAALATFSDGRTRFRSVGGRTGVAACQALLADQLAQAGRSSDASILATAARRELTDTGEAVDEVLVRIAEARVACAAGDVAAAGDHITAATRIGHEQGAHALADRAAGIAVELGAAPTP